MHADPDSMIRMSPFRFSFLSAVSLNRAVTRLLPVLLLPLLCLLAACNPKMDWREFNAQDGGFSVLFPQKPGQGEHMLATPAGKVNMKMYSVRIDETALGAGFADFPAP